MSEKFKAYLQTLPLSELASLKQVVSSLCLDYDKSLTTYANLNDDKVFSRMPADVERMHKRRMKMYSVLMSINSSIEEKIFKMCDD